MTDLVDGRPTTVPKRVCKYTKDSGHESKITECKHTEASKLCLFLESNSKTYIPDFIIQWMNFTIYRSVLFIQVSHSGFYA